MNSVTIEEGYVTSLYLGPLHLQFLFLDRFSVSNFCPVSNPQPEQLIPGGVFLKTESETRLYKRATNAQVR